MTFEMMVESTMETVKHFLMSGATGSISVSVRPFTSIAVRSGDIMVSKNGVAQHCIVPSVGYAKDLPKRE